MRIFVKLRRLNGHNALHTNCTWEWTTLNGVVGCLVTGNNNSIFLPAAGYWSGTSLTNAGSYCDYWASTVEPAPYNSSNGAYRAGSVFLSPTLFYIGYDKRFTGQSVRPVTE